MKKIFRGFFPFCSNSCVITFFLTCPTSAKKEKMKTKRTGKLQSQQQQCPPLPSLLSSSSSSSCSSTCQCLSIEQQAQYKECVPLQKKKSSGKAINLLSFSSSSSSSLPKIPSSSSDINEPENERGRHAKSKEEKDDDDEEDDEDEEKEDEYNEEEEEEEKSVQLSDLGPSCDSPSEPVSQESQDAQQVEYIVPEQTSPTFGEILRSGTLLEISYSICVIIPLGIALKIDGNNECVGTAPPVKEWAYVQLSLQFVILLINMIVLFIITRLDYRSRYFTITFFVLCADVWTCFCVLKIIYCLLNYRNKKLYTVMLGISRSFLAPWIVWILIGSAYFNKLKEAQCVSQPLFEKKKLFHSHFFLSVCVP